MSDIIKNNWKQDHVAHAVKDIEASIAFYQNIFGFSLIHREDLPNVKLAFIGLANTKIELLESINNQSLDKFIKERGETLHHICFEVDDIRAELAALKEKGVELIDETPRQGAENREIAFLKPETTNGVLIELCSKPLK